MGCDLGIRHVKTSSLLSYGRLGASRGPCRPFQTLFPLLLQSIAQITKDYGIQPGGGVILTSLLAPNAPKIK